MNKKQKDNLAKFCYKLAELSVMGILITCFMQPDMVMWKAMVGIAGAQLFAAIGFALDGDE